MSNIGSQNLKVFVNIFFYLRHRPLLSTSGIRIPSQITGDLIADASERSAKGSETVNRNLGFTNRSRYPIVVKLRNTHFTLSTTDEVYDGKYCRTRGKEAKGRGRRDVRETEHATKNV